MVRVGELRYTMQAWSLWDSPGGDGVTQFVVATLTEGMPCMIVEIDPRRKDNFEYDVMIVCEKGIGWLYVGAFSTWRLGEYEAR
jgi:multisubunit Na+/H+ antiporter MnhB subunit